MVDFVSSIKKPFSDVKTLIIGGVLNAIPILGILSGGFIVKSGEDAVNGKSALRSFALGDIVEYIIKAILAAIVGFVYALPGVIVSVIGIGAGLAAILPSLQAAPTDPTAVMALFTTALAAGGIILAIGILLVIIGALLTPMAIMNWLSNGKYGAAFSVGTAVKKALTLNYILTLIVYIVYAIVILIIASILGGILALIPVLGIFLLFIVNGIAGFALGITAYDLFAQVYSSK